ncbi:hypothetical protein JW906_10775 [bacterium]|nr:hypothetical protein [bacterium]
MQATRIHNPFRAFCLAACLVLCTGRAAAAERVTVLSAAADTAVLSFRFWSDDPAETDSGGVVSLGRAETLFLLSDESGLEASVIRSESGAGSAAASLAFVEDVALGLPFEKQLRPNRQPGSPPIVHVVPMGMTGGRHVFRLTVHPVSGNAGNPRMLRSVDVRLSGRNLRIADREMRAAILDALVSSRSVPLKKTGMGAGVSGSAGSSPKLKVWIEKEGLYILPVPMIREAGWDLDGADPRLLRMTCRGREIPIYIEGGQDGRLDFPDHIEFWAEPLWDLNRQGEKRVDPYSRHNIYWLELGERPGLRYGVKIGTPASRSAETAISLSFPFTQHEEGPGFFQRLPFAEGLDETDHWLSTGGIPGGEKSDLSFQAVEPDLFAVPQAFVRVKLRGESSDYDVHPVDIYLNDRWVASGQWSQYEPLDITSSGFSAGYLREGRNDLTLINRAGNRELSRLYLDWFEVTYPRLYRTSDNYMLFHPPRYSAGRRARFELQGFTNPDIELLRLGASRISGATVKEVIDTTGAVSYTAVFEEEIEDEQALYLALTPERKRLPDSLRVTGPNPLASSQSGVDYILIVPADSLAGEILSPLVQLREASGLTVMTVTLDSLYNAFHDGIPHPSAIRDFLKHAYFHWDRKPRFVLLVGDGYYNHKDTDHPNNLIPVVHYQTFKYGAAPSDHWYTLLDGEDDVPELAIGRLPVQDRQQLAAVVEKIVSYESSPPGPWKNRYLMIGSDGRGGTFYRQTEYLIGNSISSALEPRRLYLTGKPMDPDVGGTADLLRHLEEGVGLINFRGHGGGAIWADAGLLDLDDIQLIQNRGRLPLITSLTCFTSDFSSNRTCLGEALLTQEENGAIAFFGATGVGWVDTDHLFIQEILGVLDQYPGLSIGEIFEKAKARFLAANPNFSIAVSNAYQYTLLGDPAVHLTFPSVQPASSLDSKSVYGDAVHVHGEGLEGRYRASFQIVQADGRTLSETNTDFASPDYEAQIPLPASLTGRKAGVRIYLWDELSGDQANGFVPFIRQGAFFDSIQIHPRYPLFTDTLYFSCRAEDESGIRNLALHFIKSAGEILLPDTVHAEYSAETGLYRTTGGVTGLTPGMNVRFAFQCRNAGGIFSRSDTISFAVGNLPDFRVESVKLSGSEFTSLVVKIANLGGPTGEPVILEASCGQLAFFARDTVVFGAKESAQKALGFQAPPGVYPVTVTINPGNPVKETVYTNNSLIRNITADHFNVTPENGTSQQDAGSWVGLPDRILCLIPPGAVQTATVLEVTPDYQILEGTGSDSLPAVRIRWNVSFLNSSQPAVLSQDMQIVFYKGPQDTAAGVKPYRWDAANDQWTALAYSASDTSFTVSVRSTGLFALMAVDDAEMPRIDLQADHQLLSDGSYLSGKALITVLIQDNEGVDKNLDRLWIDLDGSRLDWQSLGAADSVPDPRRMLLSFRPDLASGSHEIWVEASDINGNTARTEIFHFTVSERFELRFLGNHPNPFRRETVFAYVLTDNARRTRLKIYTVSGRLIRTFEDSGMSAADYHEILWDGTDEWGEEVANGVYFFRLEADGFENKLSEYGKIAKIR